MKRFMGLMPSNEIEKEETFRDNFGFSITIQAGPNGWTIIWADGGTNYKDITQSTESNFNEAYNIAVKSVGKLYDISESRSISANESEGEL